MFSGHLPGLTPKASTGWVDFFPGHRIRRYSGLAVFNGWMRHCWPSDPVDQASLDAALVMVALGGNPIEAFITVKPNSA
ncbi:hypothetical protein EDD33_1807 [Nocardioides aurantiacus]|uniref:Uncharacterized protein n=2 Tax=Nocardioides aurantiacus TaxID=86796 RepID=A0A3N2CTU2_9ACTN|nr:hypothetical protein EDD33_1807 [Nocardioides aurantiacus]